MTQQQQNGQRLFFFFLVAWFVLNALQAAFTNLDPDEAYYWMYSRQLDWGYFDHPPGIAALIKIGYALIPSTLGVRLGAILMQIGSFYGMWLLLGKPTERRRVWLLIALLVSMPMLQVYGFIAVPDAPLMFFTVLFLLFYQRFLQSESWANTLLLGACMAALLYSKYHGVLLVFFTLFSNVKLLLKPKFYVASIFGALLFFPHLYWQYAHDFPSFRYHLSGRDDPYELKHTLTYIVNQFVIFNPFIFPLVIWAMIRKPIADSLERALYFIIFGFWVFFLYTTSKGHVEPQWTIILSFPFIIILWRFAIKNERFVTWIFRFAIFTMVLFLGVRLALIRGNLFSIKSNFHRTDWIGELQKEADGLPIVFRNSYRDPSEYTFYTGQQAYTFTDVDYRKNQFDIWDWEKALHNDSVVMVGPQRRFPGRLNWECDDCKQLDLTRKDFEIKLVDSLQISQKVTLRYDISEKLRPGQEVHISIIIQNPYDHAIRPEAGNMPLRLVALFYREVPSDEPLALKFEKPLRIIPANDTLMRKAQFIVPDLQPGSHQFALGIQTGGLPPSFNSKSRTVTIER